MPRKSPKASEFEEMRAVGIELAAKKVLDEEYEEAKLLFTKVLEISPNDAHVLCLLANVFILEEDFKKAEEWLDKALRTNPNYPWASYHMVLFILNIGAFGHYEPKLTH